MNPHESAKKSVVFPNTKHFMPLYIDNKVKLSVYPYMRMGIVTTASHPIFSFHGIL